jgi:hypothetical protein
LAGLVKRQTVPLKKLIPGQVGKKWKIDFLREAWRRDGKFLNPLIVSPTLHVLVGSNRLYALLAEGVTGDVDVLVVDRVRGMIRAVSKYYTPKIRPEDVMKEIVSGPPIKRIR